MTTRLSVLVRCRTAALVVALLALGVGPFASAEPIPRLKVSENRRFLVTDDGMPFFWLGDTAWELFHRLNREEAIAYLDDRAAKGFTVIQAVLLAEMDGLNAPNPYGHRPLLDNDPIRPDIKDGPGNAYWDHVDFILEAAARRGLFVALVPAWGEWVTPRFVEQPVFQTAEQGYRYGNFLDALSARFEPVALTSSGLGSRRSTYPAHSAAENPVSFQRRSKLVSPRL